MVLLEINILEVGFRINTTKYKTVQNKYFKFSGGYNKILGFYDNIRIIVKLWKIKISIVIFFK